MKSIVFTKFGGPEVLKIKEMPKPKPKEDEILIKIYATPINFGDSIVRRFNTVTPKKFHMPFLVWLIGKFYYGFKKPKLQILGSEFSGEVESIGKNVDRFKIGDKVFGFTGGRMGANSEYLCIKENGVVAHKPINMSYEEAAAVPYGAIMALSSLRMSKLKTKQSVLVNGASGGIGPIVVQLAKHHFGAIVTGVCSTPRMSYVRSLGADMVIDYTKEDFTRNGKPYDYIFDILGKCTIEMCRRSLKNNGSCLYLSFKMKHVYNMLLTSMFGKKKIVCVMVKEKLDDLIFIKELIEEGKIKSVIDKSFSFEEASEAHRYYESGNRQGSVIITFNKIGNI
ncbi:MAG: NAD(P)-dependent alcohol dehydrogenase [Bacteroidales bacterium]|jgi:NADPH:quinone reductase-like Zn-dependent oxidoreductase